MKLLLDTHVYPWYILNDPRLPNNTRLLLRDKSNDVFLSAVSVWEACLNYYLGKLPLPGDPAHFLPVQRVAHLISPLPVTEDCLRHLQDLPMIHKDPFDRMLICQAIESECHLLTDDVAILKYPVPLIALI